MDQSRNTTRDRSTTRRALLCTCGGAGIIGVVGCLDGDDETGRNTDGSSDGGTDDADETGGSTDDSNEDGAEESDDADGEPIQLESGDGWAAPHDDVEVPTEPGEAILKIGDETITFPIGLAQGGELTEDETGVTGAEKFEVRATYQGGSYRGEEIRITVTRMIGYESLEGRWAESDSVGLTWEGDAIRLGNVIYRRYEDGRLADAEIAGELEGRRFTDRPFVHVTREGVLTAVEELDSHVDESLNGRFEFGARLPENWTEI